MVRAIVFVAIIAQPFLTVQRHFGRGKLFESCFWWGWKERKELWWGQRQNGRWQKGRGGVTERMTVKVIELVLLQLGKGGGLH